MASGHSRRSIRRSLVMGERMGPPKLFGTKRDSTMSSRPSQFGKSGTSRPSVAFPSFGGPPKRSSVLNTNQSMHSARGSSVCGGPTIKKDPRPLGDKAFQSRSVKRLVTFLVEKGYPSNVSSNLHFMSKQEFVRIFNFLAELIHPCLKVAGVKLEEEMPAHLKMIRYPFPPPKSCFKAVGTPHSWPLLLGILMWMVDKNYMHAGGAMRFLAVDSNGFPIDPKESEDVASFEMYCMMYKAFMTGGGESSPSFKACVKMNIETRKEMCAKYRENKEAMLERIAELNKEKAQMSGLMKEDVETKLKETVDQKLQITKQVEELQGQLQQAALNLNQLNMTSKDYEKKLQEVEEHQKILKAKIKEQPISAEEAYKLKEQEYQLQYVIAQSEQETRHCYQCVAELQMSHNRSIQEIEQARQHINDKLRKVTSLMLPWASAVQCPELPLVDYDTSKRDDCEVFKSLMDQAKYLKGELDKLYERVSQRIITMETEVISGEETESELSSELYRRQIENEELQAKVDQKAKDLQTMEMELNAAIKKDSEQRQEMQKQLNIVQQSIQEGYRDMQEQDRKILEAKNEIKKLDRIYAEKTAQFNELLDVCVSYIAASKEYFNKSRTNVAIATQKIKEYLSEIPLQ